MSVNQNPLNPVAPRPPRLSLQTKIIAIPWSHSSQGDDKPTSPTSLNTLINAYTLSAASSEQTQIPIIAPPTPDPEISFLDTASSDSKSSSVGMISSHYSPLAGSIQNISQVVSNSKSENINFYTPCNWKTQERIKTSKRSQHLRSILRKSPISSPKSTVSLTHSSVLGQLPVRSKKRVGYKDPLTQTISTHKYVLSHIDLLATFSSYSQLSQSDSDNEYVTYVKDAPAFSKLEKRDEGRSSEIFKETRSKTTSGKDCKRRKRDDKTKWEWTIDVTEIDTGGETSICRSPLKSKRVRTARQCGLMPNESDISMPSMGADLIASN